MHPVFKSHGQRTLVSRCAYVLAMIGVALFSLASTARAQAPDPAHSTLPASVPVSFGGTHCFDVIVRDVSNNPLAGVQVAVVISGAANYCTSGGNSATTDATGKAHFCICAALHDPAATATIIAGKITLGSRPASNVEVSKQTITYTGTINSLAANYNAVQTENPATMHVIRNDSNLAPGIAVCCLFHPRGKGGLGWKHSTLDKGRFSLDLLVPSGGPVDHVCQWIEGADTLKLAHHYSWTLQGDSVMNISDAAVWSGKCPTYSLSNTITVDPLVDLWHQVGAGHVQKSYAETYRVDGTPHTLTAVCDITYPGSSTIGSDYAEAASNFSIAYNSGAQTEHVEYDTKIVAVTATPALSVWGLILLTLTLASAGVWYAFSRGRRIA
jgi:hypothetical protein